MGAIRLDELPLDTTEHVTGTCYEPFPELFDGPWVLTKIELRANQDYGR